VAVSIYQTVAYEFDDAQHGADLFNLAVPGNIYTGIMNPTNDVLEQRVAALERASPRSRYRPAARPSTTRSSTSPRPATTSSPCRSSTAAPTPCSRTCCRARASRCGSPRTTRRSARKLIDDRTKAVFFETIGNPAGNIVDVAAVAAMARSHGVATIVDNTVATPVLLKPIEWGVDIVVHSLTKYMGGHGTTLGGIIVDSGKFPWAEHADRYRALNEPEPSYHGVVYTEALGPAAFIGRARTVPLRNTGSAMSPMNAFLLMQGIETLSLRMERHCDNALAVARLKEQHPRVAMGRYAGLPGDPYHELAQSTWAAAPSGILTFGVKGGFDAGVKFYDALGAVQAPGQHRRREVAGRHPASTTHRSSRRRSSAAWASTPEAIRLSVGIEAIDDILADLDQALPTVCFPRRPRCRMAARRARKRWVPRAVRCAATSTKPRRRSSA
jgi:O-acetylhomoserine (thiol)-lyase